MSRFKLFGDQTFRGRIYKIKLAEISRTYLNKYFGVKIISIGQFVCKQLPKICSLRRLFDDVKNAKTMPISWHREKDGFIMTHKLKTETFSQQIEHSGGVILLPLTLLFSFVTIHLKLCKHLLTFCAKATMCLCIGSKFRTCKHARVEPIGV